MGGSQQIEKASVITVVVPVRGRSRRRGGVALWVPTGNGRGECPEILLAVSAHHVVDDAGVEPRCGGAREARTRVRALFVTLCAPSEHAAASSSEGMPHNRLASLRRHAYPSFAADASVFGRRGRLEPGAGWIAARIDVQRHQSPLQPSPLRYRRSAPAPDRSLQT